MTMAQRELGEGARKGTPPPQKQSVEQIVEKVARDIEWRISSIEDRISEVISDYKDELVEAIKGTHDLRVMDTRMEELAVTLRQVLSRQLPDDVRTTLDAVLRAVEGEPVDLYLLPTRVQRAGGLE